MNAREQRRTSPLADDDDEIRNIVKNGRRPKAKEKRVEINKKRKDNFLMKRSEFQVNLVVESRSRLPMALFIKIEKHVKN